MNFAGNFARAKAGVKARTGAGSEQAGARQKPRILGIYFSPKNFLPAFVRSKITAPIPITISVPHIIIAPIILLLFDTLTVVQISPNADN